jgi:hypothetical protein
MFTYDDKHRCVAFKFDCEVSDELFDFIMNNFPINQESLQNKAFKNFQKIEVPADLSFTAFWNAYNYKVGNKERARKLYELLDDNTRTLVFAGIKKYSNYLASRPNMEKAYAETFLNQRRWENSFD